MARQGQSLYALVQAVCGHDRRARHDLEDIYGSLPEVPECSAEFVRHLGEVDVWGARRRRPNLRVSSCSRLSSTGS